MVAFFNEILQCYKLLVDFLFAYKLAGVSVGYFITACFIFCIVVRYILGGIK